MSSNFKIGISFAPSKILSKELIPPKSKKDNAVKIETKEINCVLISFEFLYLILDYSHNHYTFKHFGV